MLDHRWHDATNIGAEGLNDQQWMTSKVLGAIVMTENQKGTLPEVA